jgi:uncharacterized protein YjbJ (UPF0337 family)
MPNELCCCALKPPARYGEKAMNDGDMRHDSADGIDADRTEGSLKQAGGKIKEGAGKLFGDEKMKREGQTDQGEGKLQNTWGSIKDEARETFGTDGTGRDD